ncbi:MAG: NADH-ubiquinone oxidoreductase-F iron-sulfur binding region domain-containing protein [Bacteroidales bacterium]
MATLKEDTNKDMLIQALLEGEIGELDHKDRETLARIKCDKITRPLIALSYNTASIIAGADKTYNAIRNYLEERDIDAFLKTIGSLGLTTIEPLMDVQLPGKARVTFSRVYPERVSDILDAVFNNFISEEYVLGQHPNDLHEPWESIPRIDELSFFQSQQRYILKNCGRIAPESIDEYIAHGGYRSFLMSIRNHTPEELCDLVEESRLRGRGGEGYPTGKKWKNTLNAPADKRFLICNAGESDPGAFMERMIMESDPHSLVESLGIASYAIGAQKAYIYLESEYEMASRRLQKAIDQARHYGLLGHDIFSSGFNLNIQLHQGAGAYVCGEETALIASLEGKRGMPRPKPPYPSHKGLHNNPTVVNNMETLLNVPVIVRHGPAWYKQTGTVKSSGTKVFSLSGKIERSGLVEVPMGTSLREVVYKIGGGLPDNKELKGLLIGGPAGGALTYENLDTPIDYEELKDKGCTLGSGAVVVMDEEGCILDTVKYYMHLLKKESCGKCIPCREGTRRMYEILENITQRPQEENGTFTLQRFKGVINLEKLAYVVRDTSLCGLGQRAANPILSTISAFREEYEEHIFERRCRAGVCQELSTFYIDVDKCTGCTICAQKCPTGAIVGSTKKPHFIVQERCIGCGICYESCKFGAIVRK